MLMSLLILSCLTTLLVILSFMQSPHSQKSADMQDPKLYNWAGAGGNQVLGFKNLNVIEKQFLLKKKVLFLKSILLLHGWPLISNSWDGKLEHFSISGQVLLSLAGRSENYKAALNLATE